jgi:aromatase
MPAERAERYTHTVEVCAPPGVVYGLIADASKLSLLFSPILHVEQLERDGEHERLRMWALMDGRMKSWTSLRRLDPVQRRMEFCQILPAPPLASLGGALSAHPHGPHRTRLEMTYDFSVAGGLPDDLAWARRAAAGNCRAQLAELTRGAEHWAHLDDLVLSFEDTVRVDGPPELIYDFLYRTGDWPGLVEDITRVDVTEEIPGVQHVRTHTRGRHGAHTTQSVRICFPHAGRIVHKQTAPPLPLLEAHTGEWSVLPDERGTTVLTQHSLVLRQEEVAAAPGRLAAARRSVREAVLRQDRALLAQAGHHARSAVRML